MSVISKRRLRPVRKTVKSSALPTPKKKDEANVIIDFDSLYLSAIAGENKSKKRYRRNDVIDFGKAINTYVDKGLPPRRVAQSIFDLYGYGIASEKQLRLLSDNFKAWLKAQPAEEEEEKKQPSLPRSKKVTLDKRPKRKTVTLPKERNIPSVDIPGHHVAFSADSHLQEAVLGTKPYVLATITNVVTTGNGVFRYATCSFSVEHGKKTYYGIAKLLPEDVLNEEFSFIEPGVRMSGYITSYKPKDSNKKEFKVIRPSFDERTNEAFKSLQAALVDEGTEGSEIRVSLDRFGHVANVALGFPEKCTTKELIKAGLQSYGAKSFSAFVNNGNDGELTLYLRK
jgi:hypothetical protein